MPPRRSARQAATLSPPTLSQSSSSSNPTASLQQTLHDRKRTRSNRDGIETTDEEHVTKRGRSKMVHKSVKSHSVDVEHEDQQHDDKHCVDGANEKAIEPHADTDSDITLDVDEASNKRPQQPAVTSQVECMTSKVFDYSFIVHLMLEHMTDRDALVNLILTSRAVNRSVVRYQVKCTIAGKRHVDLITQAAATFNDIPRTNSFTVPVNQRVVIKWVEIGIPDNHAFKSWLPVTVTKLDLSIAMSSARTFTAGDITSHITDLTVYGSRTILSGMLHEGLQSLATNLVLHNGSLPSSLEHLDLALGTLNPVVQDMISHLPSHLTKLVISGHLLDIMRIGTSPSSVKDMKISLSSGQNALPVAFFPIGLERLEIRTASSPDAYGLFLSSSQGTDQARRSHIVPDTVTELMLHGPFNKNGYELQAGDLPPSLRVLDLGSYAHQLRPGVLPSTLRELTLRGSNGKQPLEPGVIPDGVTHLKLFSNKSPDHKYQPIMPGVIPDSVVTLEWDYEPTRKSLIVGCIPSSVRVLIFGPGFSRDLPAGFIPGTVRSVTFGDHTKQLSLKIRVIPSGVKYLRFGEKFSNNGKPVRAGVIPDTVTHLYFARNSTFSKQCISIHFEGGTFLSVHCKKYISRSACLNDMQINNLSRDFHVNLQLFE